MFDWTPDGAEIGGAERHFCLQAQVFLDAAEQLPQPAGSVPAINLNNPRQAQHNMTLRAKVASLEDQVSTELAVANHGTQAAAFRFVAKEVLGSFGGSEIAYLRRSRWAETLPVHETLMLAGSHHAQLKPAPAPALDVTLALGAESASGELDATLQPGVEAELSLLVTLPAGDAAIVHRFDVLQYRGEEFVGGARVMTIGVTDQMLTY